MLKNARAKNASRLRARLRFAVLMAEAQGSIRVSDRVGEAAFNCDCQVVLEKPISRTWSSRGQLNALLSNLSLDHLAFVFILPDYRWLSSRSASGFGAFDVRAFMISVRRIRLGVSVSPAR
jgi:hypothetical protein